MKLKKINEALLEALIENGLTKAKYDAKRNIFNTEKRCGLYVLLRQKEAENQQQLY